MMTIEQLEYGIVNYGTPLYVFDLDKIARTVANLRKKTDGVAQLCFAMKANPSGPSDFTGKTTDFRGAERVGRAGMDH